MSRVTMPQLRWFGKVEVMQMRPTVRLLLVRATDASLARNPELTMRLVRSALERRSRREPGAPYDPEAVKARLAGRALGLHPGLGRALVRRSLRRARSRALRG